MRRALIAAGVVALSAAGAPAVAQAPAPSIKRATIDIAVREWRIFGSAVVRYDEIPARLERPPRPGAAPPEVRLCDRIRERYWDRGLGKKDMSEERAGGPPYQCGTAWSAAFVSAVLREAGVAQADFEFNEAHAVYVKAIVKRQRAAAARRDPPPPFVPHDVRDYAPRPGDLICAVRPANGARSLTVYFDHRAWDEASPPFGHCDIVVRVDRSIRRLGAIGGNVRDTVARSIVALDAEGRVIPTLERPWFVAIENRLP